MNDRTCIATRRTGDAATMLRFVVGPDSQVVADLKGRLPGRGAWVSAERQSVDLAARKGAFARAFKKPVTVPADLGDIVDRQFQEAALGALGFARKAGQCVTGASRVAESLEKGQTIAVLHASDAAEDGREKLSRLRRAIEKATGGKIAAFTLFDSLQLDLALGASHVIHAALKRGGAAQNAAQHLSRLAAYRQEGPQAAA